MDGRRKRLNVWWWLFPAVNKRVCENNWFYMSEHGVREREINKWPVDKWTLLSMSAVGSARLKLLNYATHIRVVYIHQLTAALVYWFIHKKLSILFPNNHCERSSIGWIIKVAMEANKCSGEHFLFFFYFLRWKILFFFSIKHLFHCHSCETQCFRDSLTLVLAIEIQTSGVICNQLQRN